MSGSGDSRSRFSCNYRCPDMTFAAREDRESHHCIHHGCSAPFECSVCCKQFSAERTVIRHERRCSAKPREGAPVYEPNYYTDEGERAKEQLEPKLRRLVSQQGAEALRVGVSSKPDM
eukprot:1008176_1